ncbi:hypothetical protein [Microbispora sp. H10949]|uniref:hypothetical protein n=1 Tax=Microbispora sp. H10949 TaxID=2729111 RepID=UPI0016049CD0|nr:hypothetical protein [Microbispora sp. H10949]
MGVFGGLIAWWNTIDWSKAEWGPVPAWLGLTLTLITVFGSLIAWWWRRKVRRVRRAMGPAQDLRAALHTTRLALQDIVVEPRRSPWFIDEDRRETAQTLRDLAGRLDDRKLRAQLTKASGAWDAAFASAPGADGFWAMYEGDAEPVTPRTAVDRAQDGPRFEKQGEHARAGLDAVEDALTRLNQLERKTVGRP